MYSFCYKLKKIFSDMAVFPDLDYKSRKRILEKLVIVYSSNIAIACIYTAHSLSRKTFHALGNSVQ